MPDEIRMNIVRETIKNMIETKGYKDRQEARDHVGALYAKKYITLEEMNELTDLIDGQYPVAVEEPIQL